MRRIASAAALAAMLLVGCGHGKGEKTPEVIGFDFSAEFREVPPTLRAGDPVRIAGVNVGTVRGVDRSSSSAVVRIVLTYGTDVMGRHSPIGSNARIAIRPRIFKEGAWFIDLDPGTRTAPALKAGSRIPASRTRVQEPF